MRICGIFCNVLSIALLVNSKLIEEADCSINHYSEQLLTKQILIENEYDKMADTLTAWKKRINQKLSDLEDAKRDLTEEKNNLVKLVQKELAYQKTQLLPTVELVEEAETLGVALQRKHDQMNRTLQASLSDHQLLLETLSEKSNQPIIAFSARTPTTTVHRRQKIPFFKTLLNMGDAYDNTTGVFTAPIKGIYRFTVQISPKFNQVFSVRLTADWNKSTVYIGNLRHRSDYTDGITSSASGVAMLNAGAKVAVTNLGDNTNAITNTEDDQWSSFSGLLVHAL